MKDPEAQQVKVGPAIPAAFLTFTNISTIIISNIRNIATTSKLGWASTVSTVSSQTVFASDTADGKTSRENARVYDDRKTAVSSPT